MLSALPSSVRFGTIRLHAGKYRSGHHTLPNASKLCEMGLRCFHPRVILNVMLRKTIQKQHDNPAYAGVKKEMAKPRMARSARIAKLNLETTRISERPSTTMPGTVDRIIPSPRRSLLEKAQIAVDGSDHRNQDLRIENTLTDENGDDAKLKKGAQVDVTVTARDVIRRR